jgi:hypothetical protein
MFGEGMQPSIELDLPGHSVVRRHQPAIIVEQHLFGNPAKVPEGALDTGKPTLLALVAKRPDIKPPRIAQCRYEQVHLHLLVADRHPTLAEIDLQLLARRRLKADGRARLRLQFATQMRYFPLDRPKAQSDRLLALELLPDDIGVAGMLAETLRHPFLEPSQRPRPTPSAIRHPLSTPETRCIGGPE